MEQEVTTQTRSYFVVFYFESKGRLVFDQGPWFMGESSCSCMGDQNRS